MAGGTPVVKVFVDLDGEGEAELDIGGVGGAA